MITIRPVFRYTNLVQISIPTAFLAFCLAASGLIFAGDLFWAVAAAPETATNSRAIDPWSDQPLRELDLQIPLQDLKEFGVSAQPGFDNCPAFNQAIQAAGGRRIQYRLAPGRYGIKRDLVLPENLILVFAPGALLAPGPGVTITIKGQVKAGFNRIFAGSGEVLGPLQNRVVSPAWYGARGDDKIDDTAAIQAAMQPGKEILFPNGTFLVNAATTAWGDTSGGILVPSNVRIRLGPLTILQAQATASQRYSILNLYEQENISISGGTIQGERYQHLGFGGEWGYGIAIGGSKHITLQQVTVKDCWGDGIVISYNATRTVPSQQIKINNCRAVNNRRQGLSIIGCHGAVITASSFNNSNGTAPQSGIDIEPGARQQVRDILISDCQFIGNKGCGIAVNGVKGRIERVRLINNTIREAAWGIYLAHTQGEHLLENNLVSDCSGHGLRLVDCSQIRVQDGSIVRCAPNLSLQEVLQSSIRGVTITASRNGGIQMHDSAQNDLSQNIVSENNGPSWLIKNCSRNTITANSFQSNRSSRAELVLSDRSSYNLIQNNNFRNQLIQRGKVRAASAQSLTPAPAEKTTPNCLPGMMLHIVAGKGQGQSREITSCNNLTGNMRLAVRWAILPDQTSDYEIRQGPPDTILISDPSCQGNTIAHNDCRWAQGTPSGVAVRDQGSATVIIQNRP